MKQYQTIFTLLFICFGTLLYGQNSSAIADFESTTQGILVPRMLQSERNNIPNPAQGLLVYQLDAPSGFYYNYGSAANPSWRLLGESVADTEIWTSRSDKIFAGDTAQIFLFGDTMMSYNRDNLTNTFTGPYNNKMLYIPTKSAFRLMGVSNYSVDTTMFNYDSIGEFSFATGVNNTAIGNISSILGSGSSRATNLFTAVIGGRVNEANGYSSVVLGGNNNETNENYSATIGGTNHIANGEWSAILGGSDNLTSGAYSSVIGGGGNVATGLRSSVIGGFYNQAIAGHTTVFGEKNIAHDWNEMVIGRFNEIGAGAQGFWQEDNQIFSIGIGSGEADRYNAMTVHAGGYTVFKNKKTNQHGLTSENDFDAGSFSDFYAIQGVNDVDPFYGYGVFGRGGYMGVRGDATAVGIGGRYGLYGRAGNGNSTNYGVYGVSSGSSGTNYAGYFSGNLHYTGTLTGPSDAKLKTDVLLSENVLSKLNQLKVKDYYFKQEFTERMNVSDRLQTGFVAQEIQEVFPNLVFTQVFENPDEKGVLMEYLGVNQIGMIPLLTKGIQELSAENQILRDRLTAIEAFIAQSNK